MAEPTQDGEQVLRRAIEALASIRPDSVLYDFAGGLTNLISQALGEGDSSGPPWFLRRPSSSPELDAAFDEAFPKGDSTLVDILSLMTPDEVREALSRSDAVSAQETASLKKLLLERTQLLKDAEGVVAGEGEV
jgi:hypothetical protein